MLYFFFNDTATTEIYTLSLHDALPISHSKREELLEIVNRLNPDNVVLVHGDKEAIDWIGASIIKVKKDKKVYSAIVGKNISFV